MIWLMLRALLEVDTAFFRSIRWMIACNAAEKPLVADFSEACFSYFPKEVLACLVFEADSGMRDQVPLFRVLEARKGIVKFQLDVTGRGAHAGVGHEMGANAVFQISRIIERLQAMTDYARGVTVNVGTVTGGFVFNRVPHHASAMLEMRAYDPAIYQETRHSTGLAHAAQTPMFSNARQAATRFLNTWTPLLLFLKRLLTCLLSGNSCGGGSPPVRIARWPTNHFLKVQNFF